MHIRDTNLGAYGDKDSRSRSVSKQAKLRASKAYSKKASNMVINSIQSESLDLDLDNLEKFYDNKEKNKQKQ